MNVVYDDDTESYQIMSIESNDVTSVPDVEFPVEDAEINDSNDILV